MLGIPNFLWRLLPANPILLRVVGIAGKRKRDLFTRCIYLGLLIGVVLFAIATTGGTSGMALDRLTGTSEKIFMQMSYLQLFLVALLAPIFTAGAITQEKDSQTYDILLATPLSNGQIVLGSLGSRLFFIIALLVSGIPIFSITKIFGGVAIGDIVTSFAIAAATACVTGALATAIATFKVGTRRTIFSFYMLVVIYLVGIYLLDQLSYFHPQLLDPNTGLLSGERATTSWLAGIHPFLALQTLFAGHRPPDSTLLPPSLRGWPMEWYFTNPSTFFPTFMLALAAVLVLPSIVLLRRMAQSSTSVRQSLFHWIPIRAMKANRKPRTVWSNPIAWREARTKVSVARASVLRYGFILLGLGAAVTILVLYETESSPPASYIQAGSYDATNGTLHILGIGKTYGVTPGTTVTLDGNEVATDKLYGHFEVLPLQTPKLVHGAQQLTSIDLRTISGKITRTQAQQFLLGLILVEASVIILIVTNAAASTVTREREDGTLDLLLTTPITSRYYLWGKLAGLVSYMVPLTAVPALSALLFVGADTAAYVFGGDVYLQWVVLPEAVLLLPLVLLVVVAFSTIVGMQMSLRNRTTVRAVMSSLGIVIGLMAVLGWCGLTASNSRMGQMSSAVSSFSPLGVIATVVYPEKFGGQAWENAATDEIATARIILLVFTLVATAAYAGVIWSMYTSMVKNFDMTIRRQSR